MTTKWQPLDAEPMRNGWPGGDDQVMESWCARFVRAGDPLDGIYALIDVDCFAVECEPEGFADPDDSAEERVLLVAEHGEGSDRVQTHDALYAPRFGILTMVYFGMCRDIDDPGSTELDADYEYEPGMFFYPTIEEADVAARAEVARYLAMYDLFLAWDGIAPIAH